MNVRTLSMVLVTVVPCGGLAGADDLDLTLRAETQAILEGEPFAIVLDLTNMAGAPLRLAASGQRIEVKYVGPAKYRSFTIGGDLNDDGTDGIFLVPAGKSTYVAVTALAGLFGAGKAGKYSFRATYRAPPMVWVGRIIPLSQPDRDGSDCDRAVRIEKVWQGQAVSNWLDIEIKPLDRVVDREAAKFLAEGGEWPNSNCWSGKFAPADRFTLWRECAARYRDSVFAKHCLYTLGAASRADRAIPVLTKLLAEEREFHYTDNAKVELAKALLGSMDRPASKATEEERAKALALLREVVNRYPDTDGAIEAWRVLRWFKLKVATTQPEIVEPGFEGD